VCVFAGHLTPQPGTLAYRLHCRARLLAALDRQAAESPGPQRYAAQAALVIWEELVDLERASYPQERRKR
jgi:hypothetical protein